MEATAKDLRTFEVTVTCCKTTMTIYARTNWYGPGNIKHHVDTRVVRVTLAAPPTNDEIVKYAGAMARFVSDPARRAFRPPKALVWREIATGLDPTREHGEERDGRGFAEDPLPLFDGSTPVAGMPTIPLGPKGQEGRAAQRRPPSAREPRIRKLGAGRDFPVEGS